MNDASVYQGAVGMRYRFTPALSSGITYMYMKGNGVVDNNHASQLAANVVYELSKRTEIDALGVWQRANAGAQAQINGMNGPDDASSNNVQSVVRAGMRLRFWFLVQTRIETRVRLCARE